MPRQFAHPLTSPLRYPGGKASVAGFIASVAIANGGAGGHYYEPFAGGAGVALYLLTRGIVRHIHLNDADRHIWALWFSMLHDTDRFVEAILSVELSIGEWRNQKAIYKTGDAADVFSLGFSTFYLNRCNRSGIISGAGPIGGIAQQGEWKLGARFNRTELAAKVREIAAYGDKITVDNLDAVEFLKSRLPSGNDLECTFVYLDPPYVNKAERLYLNNYQAKDHQAISDYLLARQGLKWLLSYDDTDLVRRLYASCRIQHFPVRYSLHSKRIAKELLISPSALAIPDATPKGFKYP